MQNIEFKEVTYEDGTMEFTAHMSVQEHYQWNNTVVRFGADDRDIIVPQSVEYKTDNHVSGVKITIESAENGFVLKQGNKMTVHTDMYNVRAHLDEVYNRVDEFSVEIDDELRALIKPYNDEYDWDNASLQMNVAYKAHLVRQAREAEEVHLQAVS